jgi:patatin-like phospholipase/acyl hydrolase
MEAKYPFHVLTLDGGGSKGVYSLGVLKEIEALVGVPLCQHFDLIYGTSTGAIISAMLALGASVSEVQKQYFDRIPKVMGHRSRAARTAEIQIQAKEIFGDKKFDQFLTAVGLVATNYEFEKPLIFKSYDTQAFGRQSTFIPGFGCSIADAIVASTAAFPFFERVVLKTANQGTVELMDGGFVANNPTLFAIADAIGSLRSERSTVRILSVGVGHYNEPQKSWYSQIVLKWWPFQMIQKQFASNTNTVETLRNIFFSDIACVRIDESYPDPRYETDLLETNVEKLNRLMQLGRESFAKFEPNILRDLNR